MKRKNNFTKWAATMLLMLSAASLFVVSCDDEPEPVIVKVTGVSLNKASTTLNVDGEETLTATVTPTEAANRKVTWSSSDAATASVDANGKVKGVKAGTATITATTEDGGKKATCAVTVKSTTVAVTGVTLNKASTTIGIGGEETLTATIAPAEATNQKVTWSSSDAATVSVDESGKIKGIKAGKATITVTTAEGGKKATCAVTVSISTIVVTGVTLNKTTLSLIEGASETLTATVAPANATNKTVTWKSSDASIAVVDSEGRVVALKPGVVAITATTEDGSKTANCAVTVISKASAIGVILLTLDKTSLSLGEGASETLIATVTPENATNKKVNWQSSNTSVATVDANGKVTAVKAGTATIIASSEEGGKTATCAVTVVTVPSFSIGKAWEHNEGDGILHEGWQEGLYFKLVAVNDFDLFGGNHDLVWYKDAAGTIPTNVPPAALCSYHLTGITIILNYRATTPKGKYYFRLKIGNTLSTNVGVMDVLPPTPGFSIGDPEDVDGGGFGTIYQDEPKFIQHKLIGISGMTFEGKTPTITWYTHYWGKEPAPEPPFLAFFIVPLLAENGYVTSFRANNGGSTPEGTYYFRLTIDGITSLNVGRVKVKPRRDWVHED